MIFIKIILYLGIFSISTIIGILIAKKYKDREEELNELKTALSLFETKIKFTYEPIPEIFKQISENLKPNIASLFINASKQMGQISAGKAWNNAIYSSNLNLNKEDKKVLENLSKLLGKTDINGQIQQIELVNQMLDMQIKNAEKEKEKNEKLYKTLGMVMGAGIVIILL